MRAGPILAAIGIGSFLGVVVVCGGLGAGFLYLVSQQMQQAGFTFDGVEDVDYVLHGPDEVRVGEPAVFVVEVTNTSTTEQRTLHSVDLYTELVDQGSFDVDPAPQQRNHSRGSEYAELVFERDLAPGATDRIEVTFRPDREDSHYVNIDACIDGPLNFIERFHTLNVRPAASD